MDDRLRRERRRFIQILLRASLAISTVLMGAGFASWVSMGETTARAVAPVRLPPSLDLGNRLMLAGVVVLAITPALQVLALLVLWARERAWRFVATAALVVALLAVAVVIGGR